jgi:NADH-quinone oxidoreductase subunit C
VSRLSSADGPPSVETAPEETAPEDTAAPEETAPPSDPPREELLEGLTAALGDAVVESEINRGDLWVRVRADAWKQAAEVCRDTLGLTYFCFLSGLDWMPSAPNPEESVSTDISADAEDAPDEDAAQQAEAEQEQPVTDDDADAAADAKTVADATGGAVSGVVSGVAGGDTRFQVFARYYSTTRHVGLTLKADLDEEAPTVESIHTVFRGADWHERETWEMYGFTFVGHPDLTHLYLPGEFEGFPLRKDYPLLAREVKPWPGLVDVELMPEVPDVPDAGEAASVEEPAG